MLVAKNEVPVIYTYLAHYRTAVVRELINSAKHRFVFLEDKNLSARLGIEPLGPTDPSRLTHAPCIALPGGLLLQSGLLGPAMSAKNNTIIYFGDVHFVSTWISALLARIRGKRVLFWTHGWLRDERGLKSWLRCTFYRLAHGLLLYGERAKRYGIEKRFKSKDLYVVYNSLDTERQEEIRSRITMDQIREVRKQLFGHWNVPMIVCTTRLVASKQIGLLLEAASILKDEHHAVDVLIVGDGPERSKLEAMAKAKGISTVFYGSCFEEERLGLLLMAANATVIPGSIGLTVMHSLIYGTPVITHDDADQQGPEWEAIMPGTNGQFFKRGDPAALAKAIQQWTSSALPEESTRKKYYRSIEQKYRPSYQVKIIESAIGGISADSAHEVASD